MRSARVEVCDVLAKGGLEVTSSEDDDVVETLASHRTEEPLAGGVDQRRPHRALDDAGAGTDGRAIEVGSEFAVSIANDELGALAERSGVAQLLRDPSSRGGASDPDVNDALRVHIHDEEREDWPEPQVMELQEIARPYLRAAAADFYQLRWSKEILDEMERNLVSTMTMSADEAARLRAQMEKYFPEAMVTGYEPLIAGMRNDTKDRHVVAAAVKAGAQVVTTVNLKDFTPLTDGIEAQSPDEFLCNLFDLDPQSFIDMLRTQAADLHKPPVTFEELLERLFRAVPDLVGAFAFPGRCERREPVPPRALRTG
jgi:hypothetical protein